MPSDKILSVGEHLRLILGAASFQLPGSRPLTLTTPAALSRLLMLGKFEPFAREIQRPQRAAAQSSAAARAPLGSHLLGEPTTLNERFAH